MLLLCVVMLIFHNHTSAKNPDFCQKSAQNTEKSPQKTLFLHLYHFISLFDHTPTVPPPPQVCQSGLTIRGHFGITHFSSKYFALDKNND